jgi:transcriptional regulator with XRE-family HTH domain
MITPQQIKAARALLQWKQTTLAEHAGISLPSINNVERGIGSARLDTMQAIQMALENAGIEFLSGLGVRLREDVFDVHKYEGPDFIKKLNDDLFSCMKGPEDEVVMCSINETMFPKHVPDEMIRYFNHHKKTRFTEKILIRKDDNFLLASPDTYRWIAPELIGTIPYYVYKDRFAMIMWEASRSIIIRNQSIAETFRKQFDFLWSLGTPLPPGPGITNKLEDPDFTKKYTK